MTCRIRNMAFATRANSSEQESVEGCSRQTRTTSSNDLSEWEEDNISHQDNCTDQKAAPEVGINAKLHTCIRKIFNTVWAIFQIVKSKVPLVATKIEQSKPSLEQLKPRQMDKMMRRLSSSFKSVQKTFRVGERWEEIQGCDGWANLLNPMDPGLRAEIYRYGEFAKATYDAFDRNTGACKYKEEELLKEMGLEDRGYEISDFLYTTAQLRLPKFLSKFVDIKWKYSNWMGFVAVCTAPREIKRLGRRDIVVAWRGTITLFEWIKDCQFWSGKPVQFNTQNTSRGFKVESGFLSVYNSSNEESLCDKNSASRQVLGAVRELVEKYRKEDKQEDIKLSITVTGHSLGSALAILSAYEIAESSWIHQPQENSSFGSGSGGIGRPSEIVSDKSFPNDRIPITVYSFAGPRVGKRAFKTRIEELGVAVLRVVNKHDIVPKLPRMIFSSYEHVGQEFEINNLTCDYFEETKQVPTAENSEETTEGTKTATTDETAQCKTTETTQKAVIAIHAHILQRDGRNLLNLFCYLAEQHRLRGMLDRLSPGCLRAYVDMLEGLQRRRLLFRRRIRTSYLGAIFLKMLQGTATTSPHALDEDAFVLDNVKDGEVDVVRGQ